MPALFQGMNEKLPGAARRVYTQESMTSSSPATPVDPFSATPAWRSTWVLLRFALVLAGVVATLTAMLALLYVQDRRHEGAIVRQQVQDVVNLQYELVLRELRSIESDLLVLSEQESLRAFLRDPSSGRASLETEYARFERVKGLYDQIRVLDTEGRETLRVNYRDGSPESVPADQLQGKAMRYYYRQALALSIGEVLVTPFDLNVEQGAIEEPLKPVIRLITPLQDAQARPQALLVLNYLGTRLLQKLIEVTSGMRGQYLLLNGDGEYLLAPESGSAWGWMLGHHRSFASEHPEAWQVVLKERQGEYQSARGLYTFRWFDPLPETIAAKTDMREARTSGGVNRSTLILTAFVPHETLYANSRRLLERLAWLHGLATLLLAGLAWYLVRARWLRIAQDRQIAESEQRLRRLSSQLLAAQEDERRNISRELHDDLGQQVTAIRLDVHSALAEPEGVRREGLLQAAAREVDELLRSLHRIASRTRPFVLDDLGLQDAIESHITEFERRTGIDVATDLAIPVRRLNSTMADNVYRIIQEALNNIAKHAQAPRAEVTIFAEEGQLHLRVFDAGRGFQLEQRDPTRLGLLGIRERAELLGGRLRIETSPGQGTRLAVTIPLQSTQDSHGT